MLTPSNKRSETYRGRFAPSPSGELHFGSLIAALASYLDARHHDGKWLIRIEDIDPPREQPGADKSILNTLEAYGLYWDESVLYQSKQTGYYRCVIDQLLQSEQAYYCRCTRAQIKAIGGIYIGHCRTLEHAPEGSAIRVINPYNNARYLDIFQGEVTSNQQLAGEDFIILRRDGLFAYQLAVVLDDLYQNINHVVRGCDLLEPTARQLSFYQILKQNAPQFGHVPLAVTDQGYKLSKQNKAPAICTKHPQPSLIQALSFLGQQPPIELTNASVDEIIQWATEHWQRKKVPKQKEIML